MENQPRLSTTGSASAPAKRLDKWSKTPSPNPRYGGMTPEQFVRAMLKPGYERRDESRETS